MAEVIQKEDEKSNIVMDYMPKKISVPVTREAQSFIMAQPQQNASNFRLSDLIAQQTGIHELEKASVEKRIEQKALERLKEIQEKAYEEAYSLGLEEGTKKGHQEAQQEVSQRLQDLNVLLEKFAQIKVDILQRNEIQIVDFVYFLASKLAYREIQKDEQRIIPVLRHAMETLQKDENMVIKISTHDLSQIDELKKISSQEFEFLNRVKFEPLETIEPGGCIIETNYGLIDATIEERVNKLLTTLDENKPNTKKDQFE